MFKTIIRYLYYALFIFVPLVMSSQTSELFEFNKLLVIYAISVAIGCLWAINLVIRGGAVRLFPYLTVPFLVFLLSQFVSTAFSIDIHTSIFGYYGRFNGGLVSIIAYFVLFFVFLQVFERKDIPRLLFVSMIASVIVVLWGIPGWFGSDLSCRVFTGQWTNTCWTNQFRPAERMFSTLGQPNWLGAYLAIHLCLGLWFVFRRFFPHHCNQIDSYKEKQNTMESTPSLISLYQILGYGYLFLMFAGLLFTRSRSALLAAAVCVGVGMVLVGYTVYRRTQEKRHFASHPAIQSLGVLAGGFAIILFLVQTGIPRIDSALSFTSLSSQTSPVETITPANEPSQDSSSAESSPVLKQDVTDSFDIRLIVWQGAWELAKQYPLFGTGVETYAYAYYFTRPAAHNMTSEWDFIYNKAHNEYLNYLATTGFIGFITYMGLIGSIFYSGWLVLRKTSQSTDKQQLSFSAFVTSVSRSDVLIFLLLLAYISILITNCFGFSVTSVNIFFYTFPAMIGLHLSPNYQQPVKQIPRLNTFGASIAVIVLSLGMVYLLQSIYQYRSADIVFAQAKTLSSAQRYDTAVEYFEEALGKRFEHVYQDQFSGMLAQYALLVGFDNEDVQETTEALIEYADNYNMLSLQGSPQNVIYWKTKIRNGYLFYYATDDRRYLTEGLEDVKITKELAPTDPKILHSEGLYYSLLAADDETEEDMKVEYREKSIASLDAAILLKPNFRDAYVLKGQLLAQYGREDEAREAFEFVLENIEPRDTEVLEELEKL